MNNAFADGRIDNGYRLTEGVLCLFFVTGLDCSNDFFDESAEFATLSGIVETSCFRLTCSFFSLG